MILILDSTPDHMSTSPSALIRLLTVGFGKDIIYFSGGMNEDDGERREEKQTSMSTCVVTFIPFTNTFSV